jgi:Glyoxalase-like domain
MYTKIQVAFDAADPPKLAAFWALALGCIPEPPPEGLASWEDFGRSIGMPEERFGDQAAVIDPEGAGPRVYFQRVPEGKTAKYRVHLDVRVAGLEVRGRNARPIEEQVARLTGRVPRSPGGRTTYAAAAWSCAIRRETNSASHDHRDRRSGRIRLTCHDDVGLGHPQQVPRL